MIKEIDVDGVKTIYEETGSPDGKPVVILHGWGCTHATVASVAATLQSGMRVINVDLPGHGDSAEPGEIWGTEDYANFVIRLLELLDIQNPSLVGHSFGGRTSISVATKIPVNKLVLIDSAGIKPRRSLKYYYKVYSFKTMKRLMPLIFGKKRASELIEDMRNKKGSADYRNSSPMMRAIMSRCVNEDLKKQMPHIASPTLLIWGDNDTATPLSDARTMEKLIPDAGLVSFAGCGHYSFLDNPIGFKAVMREFFKNELA